MTRRARTLPPVPRSRPAVLLVTAVLFTAILSLNFALTYSAGSSGEAVAAGIPVTQQGPPPSCCGDDDLKPHLLAASYYSLKGGLGAKLLLNNKGPRPLEVKPTLFSAGGERYEVAPVTVEGNTFQIINLRQWVRLAGPQFREGSIQVFHLGRDLVLGAQLHLEDEKRGLSFEEKFVELANLPSSRLGGVWWLPSEKGAVLLALSNTTDYALTATARAEGAEPARGGESIVTLQPHETRLLDVQADIIGKGRGALSRFGGITVEYTGPRGAVIARGFAQDPARGFSLAVQFSDPQSAKSSSYQGVGLRLGGAGGEALRPVAVAHNAGAFETTVTGRVPYTTADGAAVEVTLPEVRLTPGETKLIDVAGALEAAGSPQDFSGAGLEFEYSTDPGSVQMTALSVSDGGEQVFRLPLWDVAAQRSATGGYPWFIDGSSSTVVYLKNATAEPQQYTFRLGFDRGAYLVGVRTVEPRQTITFDVRELRDKQVPDDDGVTIPPAATSGQIVWSVYGPDGLGMIGRSEQVDAAKGLSSSYACQSCCPDSYLESKVETLNSTVGVGGTATYVAREKRSTCYGQEPGWYTVGASWSSLNTAVATVVGGQATGEGPGTTNVRASWTAYSRFPSFGGCQSTSFTVSPVAPINVIKVNILLSGTDITDQTRDVIVGQKVILNAAVLPAGTSFTNPQWTVPGNRIANYTIVCNGALEADHTTRCGQPTSAAQIPLTNLTDSSVTFYWVDGGDGREVRYAVVVNGKTISGKAIWNVKRPTASVTVATGAIGISPEGTHDWLRFGVPPTPGITFDESVTIPSGFDGDTQWVQIADASARRFDVDLGIWEMFEAVGLDTSYPYSIEADTQDSPGLRLDPDKYPRMIANQNFQMWLMFRPDPSSTSIWVPLRVVNWGWSADASHNGSNWTVTSSSVITPQQADTTDFPLWSSNAADHEWGVE